MLQIQPFQSISLCEHDTLWKRVSQYESDAILAIGRIRIAFKMEEIICFTPGRENTAVTAAFLCDTVLHDSMKVQNVLVLWAYEAILLRSYMQAPNLIFHESTLFSYLSVILTSYCLASFPKKSIVLCKKMRLFVRKLLN